MLQPSQGLNGLLNRHGPEVCLHLGMEGNAPVLSLLPLDWSAMKPYAIAHEKIVRNR